MLFNYFYLICLMIIVVDVRLIEKTSCMPTKFLSLSNCSFRHAYYHPTTSIDNTRRLSMIVPYALNQTEEEDLLISIVTPQSSSKPLIRLNLNLIRCEHFPRDLHWTSLQSSSTITGEFVRTNHLDENRMYLPSGVTYLKNFTSTDCSTQTFYYTDDEQLFHLDLRIESTLNDSCLSDQSCFPSETYRCDLNEQRCVCREPYQVYSIANRYPICVHAVPNTDECSTKDVRCFPWCHVNQSLSLCLCPERQSTKKFSVNGQAFCESSTGGMCNPFLQCSSSDQCLDGICQHIPATFDRFLTLDFVRSSILVTCLILFLISMTLTSLFCLLRRRQWRKQYEPPIETVSSRSKQVQRSINDYDNVTYDAPRQRREATSYEPQILFLGGEQQLTAIFA